MAGPSERFTLPVISIEAPTELSLTGDTCGPLNHSKLESTPRKSKLAIPDTITLSSPTKSLCSTASACRICHEGDAVGSLMSPCECKGTIALVHSCCLEKWLTTSNTTQCEVCHYAFKVKKTLRPSTQWLTARRARTFYFDMMCLFFFIPAGVAVACLCTRVGILYLQKGKWEGLGLLMVTVTLVFCLSVWIYFTIRYHIRSFQTWRNSNPQIQLIPLRLRFSNRSRASNRSLNP